MAVVQRFGPAPRAGHLKAQDPGNAELAALVGAHQRQVWRYLRLLGADDHEADDLMQESFVCLAQRLQGGDPIAAPLAFLRGTARHLLLGARRRQSRRPPTVEWIDAVDGYLSDHPASIDDHRVDHLQHCIERLRGRVRQAVAWHHLEGVPIADIGDRLGLSPSGIKSMLRRARGLLRQCVERREQQDHDKESAR